MVSAVKRLRAILFCLLLVWMQAMVAAPGVLSGTERVACACCDCGKADCCVTKSPPTPAAPAPLAPVRADSQNQLSLHYTTATAWTLPDAGSRVVAPSASSPLTAARVPLFARDCARLI
jgi:hypothetical protein